jgi:hypothetical protein
MEANPGCAHSSSLCWYSPSIVIQALEGNPRPHALRTIETRGRAFFYRRAGKSLLQHPIHATINSRQQPIMRRAIENCTVAHSGEPKLNDVEGIYAAEDTNNGIFRFRAACIRRQDSLLKITLPE